MTNFPSDCAHIRFYKVSAEIVSGPVGGHRVLRMTQMLAAMRDGYDGRRLCRSSGYRDQNGQEGAHHFIVEEKRWLAIPIDA